MKLGPLSAWRSRAAQIRLFKRSLQVFGACWLAVEPLGYWLPQYFEWGFKGYIALVLISLIIGLIWAWPRSAITRRLTLSDTRISVEVSDLLDQRGNLIVGVTDVFDTEIGDVISPSSLQGQLQARVFPNADEFDTMISEALAGTDPSEIDESKTRGKKTRYPIGTVAIVGRGTSRYFLSAYSRMGSNLQAKSDICKLTSSLEVCWDAIRVKGQHEPVHMGVIGSRFSRTGLPRALLLQFIILSFLDEERRASLTNHLHVHIHPDDAMHIDFVDLEDWLGGLTRAG